MTLPGLVRANNLSDVINRERAWDNLGSSLNTGDIAIAAPSLNLNFAATKSLADSVSGQQLIQFSRSSVGRYLDSDGILKSASNNIPRFEHNISGQCIGLLAEPARTNFAWPSNAVEFNTGGGQCWSTEGSQASRTNNVAISPDGTQNAAKIFKNNGQSFGYVRFSRGNPNFGPPLVGQTISCFFKAAELSIITIYATAFGQYYAIDLAAGTTQIGNLIPYPNGWYRWFRTQDITNQTYRIYPGGDLYVGNGVSGVFIWGAQIEDGPLSSLIYAPGSYVTRSADVVTISGSNLSSFYDSSAGTIYVEQPRQVSISGVVLGQSANNRLLDWQSSRIYRTSWEGVDYVWNGAPAVSAISLNRAALSYGPGWRGAVNGTSYSLSPYSASGVFTATSLSFQGVLSRLTYWNNQLPEAAIAAITSLSNTTTGNLPSSYSVNATIKGKDVIALEDVRNASTRDFVFIKGLTSAAQPRITTAANNTASGVARRDLAMPKLAPTTSGNYFFSSGITLSGVSTRINNTPALSIATSPFSGSTATAPLLFRELRPQANWRITESMSSGTIATPELAIPFETNDFVLYMKAGQN